MSVTTKLECLTNRDQLKQHICENIGAKSCDHVIQQRHITKTNSSACKESNTFIIAKTKAVKAVCKDKGEQYENMTKSIEKFKILTCKLKNRSARYPKCGYPRTRRIAIKCDQGFPVHFDRDIIHFDN
uniref:Ribonuclease A-domain domain-containing protein n=1 Tax=Lates calcarifer TaxID=8187 RepID=A0A4W6FAM3_LATCA